MSTTYAEFRVVCTCGDLVVPPIDSLSALQTIMQDLRRPPVDDHLPVVQVRTVQVTDWRAHSPVFKRTSEIWLYKRPEGDTIHGRPCSRAPEARHWTWADTETDETVARWVRAGFYNACTRCRPLKGVL